MSEDSVAVKISPIPLTRSTFLNLHTMAQELRKHSRAQWTGLQCQTGVRLRQRTFDGRRAHGRHSSTTVGSSFFAVAAVARIPTFLNQGYSNVFDPSRRAPRNRIAA